MKLVSNRRKRRRRIELRTRSTCDNGPNLTRADFMAVNTTFEERALYLNSDRRSSRRKLARGSLAA